MKKKESLSSNRTNGYIMIFLAGILWGSIGLFVKLLTGVGASSSLAAFMRLFMGFCILVPILFFMGRGFKMFKIDKTSLLQCLLLGVLSQALFNYCYNMCIGNVGVATASILLYTAPVFVSVMAVAFFKESIGKLKITALLLNIFGCFLMVTGGNIAMLKISSLGVIFGLASAFLYSLVTIIGKIASGKTHPFTVVLYSFLFGWLTLGVITRPWELIVVISGSEFWLYVFGYGLIPTVGSYLLYMEGLSKNLELSRVPILASIETVVATLIGVLLFNEKIAFINILGIICLLFSIAMMNLGFKSSPKKAIDCES